MTSAILNGCFRRHAQADAPPPPTHTHTHTHTHAHPNTNKCTHTLMDQTLHFGLVLNSDVFFWFVLFSFVSHGVVLVKGNDRKESRSIIVGNCMFIWPRPHLSFVWRHISQDGRLVVHKAQAKATTPINCKGL